jgi:hypothetical protein
MQIGVNIINKAMDSVFNNVSQNYSIKLVYDGGIESTANTVDFTSASGGSVSITASTYFAVSSGTTVTRIRVYDSPLSRLLIDEPLDTPKTYTANGTFTINSLTVTNGGTTLLNGLILGHLRTNIKFVYIIDDTGSLVQIGDDRASFAAKVVSYPSYLTLFWDTPSNNSVTTTNNIPNGNPINFSIKGGVRVERLIFTNDNVVVATLDIPSPTYTTLENPYYIRSVFMSITEA